MPYKDRNKRRQSQREADKRYASKHPLRLKAKKAAWHANKKARQLGVEGLLSRADLEKLLEKCSLCSECGSSENLSIDHKVPFKKGGTNYIDNIQILCWQCNMEKTYKDARDSWSVHGEACKICGTSEKRHEAQGLCMKCYKRQRLNQSVPAPM